MLVELFASASTERGALYRGDFGERTVQPTALNLPAVPYCQPRLEALYEKARLVRFAAVDVGPLSTSPPQLPAGGLRALQRKTDPGRRLDAAIPGAALCEL